ncbi:MAG TPA: hypothetical protein VE088_04960 [Gaiellaceae bacterium]|jgi:hypothetical protein|nr:hypothetical protein [Gaiellaceae bacterium]
MITVETTDTISALDLVQRLRRYRAHSAPLDGGAQEVVIEHVPSGHFRDILGHVSDWASAYGLDDVALRIGSATYRLHLDRGGGLAWHDVT